MNGSQRTRESRFEPVAITGLGAIVPGASTAQEYWKLLCSGRSTAQSLDRLAKARLPVRMGCTVAQTADELVGRRAARRQDRVSQLAIVAAREALEDAELDHAVSPDRSGIFAGTAFGGADAIQSAAEHHCAGKRPPPLSIPQIMPNGTAAELAIALGWTGPSVNCGSACASSLLALGDGARAVAAGEVDVAIAGGAEAPIAPFWVDGFARLGAMSTRNDDPASASRPFDRDRDGFVIGEGAAFCVLERLSDALARGARPLALITGYGRSADAYHIVAPPPDGAGAVASMRRALASAGIEPSEVVHLQAHGTSTAQNDSAEATAIGTVFGPTTPPVGATKGAVGHLIGASGAVATAAGILAMQHGLAPPVANFHAGDPGSVLDVVHGEPRPIPAGPVLINSFGFGGHNCSLVIAPAP